MFTHESKYVKYPRTYHVPWSCPENDDRSHATTEMFDGKNVVITEKMDGENVTIYNDYFHSRSISSNRRDDHSWIARYQATIGGSIPVGFRVCGEYLYSQHSIPYRDLVSYFYGFSVWDRSRCLSWDETELWLSLLEIPVVRVLYRGPWDVDVAKSLAQELPLDKVEGYVVRSDGGFDYIDFQKNVAKFVRSNHLRTDNQWIATRERNHLENAALTRL